MKFIHEKYESIWRISTLLAFILILGNSFTLKNDIISIVIFIVYAVFMTIVGITNKKYKKKM